MKTSENTIDSKTAKTVALRRHYEETTGEKAIDYSYPNGQVVETFTDDYVAWLEARAMWTIEKKVGTFVETKNSTSLTTRNGTIRFDKNWRNR